MKRGGLIAGFLKRAYLAVESLVLRHKRKKDVLIVVHNKLMWTYARPLYEGLRRDKGMRVWVCFVWPHLWESGDIRALVKRFSLRTVPYRLGVYLKWDLIVFPNHGPYFRRDCRKIYIGHGLHSGKLVGGKSYVFGSRSLDERGKILYDRLFVSSEFVRSQVKDHHPDFYPVVRAVGSLLMDEMLNGHRRSREEVLKEINLDPGRRTMMIASTWGPFSLIENQGMELVKKLPALCAKYNVILSLHLLNYGIWPSEGRNWKPILDKVKVKNLYIIPPGIGGHLYMEAADLLVTDHSSVGLYFPAYARPIIYYQRPDLKLDGVSLTHELRSVSYCVRDTSSLSADIGRALSNFDVRPMEELADKIASYPGRAQERYLEELLSLMGMDGKR
ncbi:MAG: CDP-glycerol glycerophosphotransferase family protein [Candidatus Omnitrophica bacterium]|nr:CDP-glycerol glycerophosphotransferase family protein [Candidatus Omnitrophota bacterium]